MRRHRINGQGKGLMKGLAKSKKLIRAERASRVVWPAAWKALPEVNAKMSELIESEARKINAVMRGKQ
jgi:carbon monoxide dehydrogenase subunit G